MPENQITISLTTPLEQEIEHAIRKGAALKPKDSIVAGWSWENIRDHVDDKIIKPLHTPEESARFHKSSDELLDRYGCEIAK